MFVGNFSAVFRRTLLESGAFEGYRLTLKRVLSNLWGRWLPTMKAALIAILSAAAAGVCSAFLPWRQDTPSPLFTIAVVFSSWRGGFRGGLLSAFFSVISWQLIFFKEAGVRGLDSEDIFEIGAFTFAALVIGKLFSQLQEEKKRLADLNETLELRVAERTKNLREAVEELEHLLYTIAHDLRAPLRAMGGFSQLLIQDHAAGLDDDGKEFCRRIDISAKRMDRLILDVLEYGALGRSTAQLEKLSLGEAIDMAMSSLATDIQKRGAQIKIMAPLPWVHGDARFLSKVLCRLLQNAMRFVAPGVSPRILIRAERNSGKVRLWIEDNGVGIDPAYQENIFLMFHRLETTSGGHETGAGLAIARRAARRMNGEIGVESQLGAGSRFWLELPEFVTRI